MNLFDSHAHLSAKHFDNDRQEILEKLEKNNTLVLDCATQESDFQAVIDNAKNKNIFCSLGVHPHSSSEVSKNYIEQIELLSKNLKCVAIGEIGLDYHYDFSPRETQKKVLIEQIELSIALNLPVVLHDREAHHDMYNILNRYKGRLNGVMHCYSGGAGLVSQTLELGLYVGFGGALTFNNARKNVDAAELVPLNRLLIETDCPYMTPAPFRGKRNEPSYVELVCEKLAQIKALDSEHIAQTTLENAKTLFKIL